MTIVILLGTYKLKFTKDTEVKTVTFDGIY